MTGVLARKHTHNVILLRGLGSAKASVFIEAKDGEGVLLKKYTQGFEEKMRGITIRG